MRLYHFTTLGTAWAQILGPGNDCLRRSASTGSITVAGGCFVVTQPRPGVSLTTNPRLTRTPNAGGDGRPWAPVRLEIDGAVLESRGVKLEPYLDEMHGITEADDQREILIRQDEVSLKGALIGVEINPEAHLYDEALNSIEQHYDEETQSHESMSMELKMAKYGPEEAERVRQFVAWCRSEGIPVAEVKDFSLPAAASPEGRLLSGAERIEPPEIKSERSPAGPDLAP